MTSWPSAFFLMCSTEVADHLDVDVGLEQGETDFAQGLVDVGFGNPALAPELP